MVSVSKINIDENLPQFFCEADIVFVNRDHKNHGIIHFVVKKLKFKNITAISYQLFLDLRNQFQIHNQRPQKPTSRDFLDKKKF